MGALTIISRESKCFNDRVEAGRALASRLGERRGQGAVVLGIPRGGVVVAHELAQGLAAQLDIVLARKLGAPGNPELAIGAATESGKIFVNEFIARASGASRDFIDRQRRAAMEEIARRVRAYRAVCPAVPLHGRVVIVTDDGVATGATMQAALWALRQERPSELVLALPVAPEDTVNRLAADADWTICLCVPPFFQAVGQFYRAFEQTTDEEVIDLLRESTNWKP